MVSQIGALDQRVGQVGQQPRAVRVTGVGARDGLPQGLDRDLQVGQVAARPPAPPAPVREQVETGQLVASEPLGDFPAGCAEHLQHLPARLQRPYVAGDHVPLDQSRGVAREHARVGVLVVPEVQRGLPDPDEGQEVGVGGRRGGPGLGQVEQGEQRLGPLLAARRELGGREMGPDQLVVAGDGQAEHRRQLAQVAAVAGRAERRPQVYVDRVVERLRLPRGREQPEQPAAQDRQRLRRPDGMRGLHRLPQQ
jgi:hypothetical protein